MDGTSIILPPTQTCNLLITCVMYIFFSILISSSELQCDTRIIKSIQLSAQNNFVKRFQNKTTVQKATLLIKHFTIHYLIL